MALDPITLLLMVRESYAQQRRDLIAENCDRDAVTGELILCTFRMEALDGLFEIDRWLEQIDATLMEQGAEDQPQPTPIPSNIIQFPGRMARPVLVNGDAA